jgi:5,10-methenyltetrahydromethanopterin hydrogenase
MSVHKIKFNATDITSLMHNPHEVIEGHVNGNQYTLRVAIPNYVNNILKHYPNVTDEELKHIYESTDIKLDHQHFGLICEFEKKLKPTCMMMK